MENSGTRVDLVLVISASLFAQLLATAHENYIMGLDLYRIFRVAMYLSPDVHCYLQDWFTLSPGLVHGHYLISPGLVHVISRTGSRTLFNISLAGSRTLFNISMAGSRTLFHISRAGSRTLFNIF